MDLRKPMTQSEIKLFKQRIIREYKEKHMVQPKKKPWEIAVERLRTIAPFNLIVGLITLAIVGIFLGWDKVIYMILSGIVWVTIISTVIAALFKAK
ncbi:hypothetical protein K9M79_07280 [Candidatus Woesearchaeota archaeon]|nr:hypothetical protein [Candidatus Woesearchaeota archaeon]